MKNNLTMTKQNQKLYIGVDVGGTKILGGVLDGEGKVLIRKKFSTPLDARPAVIAKGIAELIRALQDNAVAKISGIGLGIPGIVAPNFKDILNTPNINLSRYPLHRALLKEFKVPVVLGNDVNCGLIAEQWLGSARDAQNVVGIFPGTGVGGGIIINGKIYTGSQGAAAELGHMIIDYNSLITHAGVKGSLEALASRQAIERMIRAAIKRKERTIVTKITDGDLDVIKSKVIAKALKRKDRVVAGIINEVCEIFGQACISLRHVFNPELIVFGGGLIEACGGYMLPRIRAVSAGDTFFKGIDRCRIVASQLGDDAVMLGAVKLLLDTKR